MNNMGYSFTFNTDLDSFLDVSSSENVMNVIAQTLNVTKNRIIVTSLDTGSTIMAGGVMAGSSAEVAILSALMNAALVGNSRLFGFTITDWTISDNVYNGNNNGGGGGGNGGGSGGNGGSSSNPDTSPSANTVIALQLGTIIGIAVGGGVALILVIILIIYCVRCRRKV